MKFHKTNQSSRGSITYRYTLTDEQGREHEVREVVRPGEDDVTEADISLYYRDEDGEVDNNIKNARPRRTAKEKRSIREWREKFIADFKDKYGYEPDSDYVDFSQEEAFPKNWCLSLDSSAEHGYDDADESPVLHSASYAVDYDAVVIFRQALEVVSALNAEQQEIFRRVFIDNETPSEVARAMGIENRQSVTKRVNRILNRIRKELGVKK